MTQASSVTFERSLPELQKFVANLCQELEPGNSWQNDDYFEDKPDIVFCWSDLQDIPTVRSATLDRLIERLIHPIYIGMSERSYFTLKITNHPASFSPDLQILPFEMFFSPPIDHLFLLIYY